MAFKMAFQDSAGINHTQSYWRVVSTNLSQAEKVARIVLCGYADQAAREAGRSGIGQKAYAIRGADYDQWFATSGLNLRGQNHIRAAYAYAKSCPEIDDEKVNPSFFENASDV